MLESGFHLMDCLEGMKQFPDGFFDLAIVDPPYGINADTFNNGSGAKKDKGMKYGSAVRCRKGRLNQGAGKLKNRLLNNSDCGWDSEPPTDEYFNELMRVSKHQIIWGGQLLQSAANTWDCRMGQSATVGEFLASRVGMDII